MITAGELAESALKRILVQASEAPLEPDQYADFFADMNAFMASLYADGIRLGYTPVDNVADEVTIPDGAVRGVIANMALEVAPDYAAEVSPQLQQQASAGMKTLRRLGRFKNFKTRKPSTLPIGGSQHHCGTGDFYGDSARARMTLSDNRRATRLSVTNNEYPINGHWETEFSSAVLCDIDGRMENFSDKVFDVKINVAMDVLADGAFVFSIIKNSVDPVISHAAPITAPGGRVEFSGQVTLAPGDFVQLHAADTAATSQITVTTARVEVR